jgi:hypothetical protein
MLNNNSRLTACQIRLNKTLLKTTSLLRIKFMDELKLNKYLESFEVFHPLDCVLVINDVGLVHGDDEGKLRLVQDTARVQHVLKFQVEETHLSHVTVLV